jgi:cell division protein FtsI/penicillin-binding protein 2
LILAHISPVISAPKYSFSRQILAHRGSIYSAKGKEYPFVKSVPYWEYRLDPVHLTNAISRVRPKGEKAPRTRKAILKTIADTLGLEYRRVLEMANAVGQKGFRYQFLALSSDPDAFRTLANSRLVSGVSISDRQVRQYIHGRHLSHVLGSVNAEGVGSAGIEQRYNRDLTGTAGTIQGMRDAFGREIYDKRKIDIDPIPGSDVYLTIDHNIQYEVEYALDWGVKEFGAGSGWSIVMDASTGAILAMASLPDFEPLEYGHISDAEKLNRAIGCNYEPGSVMKVITAAAAVDAGFVTASTRYRTNRDDPSYYKLPGDGSHVWEPTMTIKDAIVHSSNIVIGKLGYDFGRQRLWEYFRAFGFGQKTGIELPGEQSGIIRDWHKWDKATWSRAPIGQGLSVTAIQLVSAYQAIANDGVRMRPYIVDKVVASNGYVVHQTEPKEISRPISAKAARAMREMMLGVAKPGGTARRAAVRGYTIAGKTGTAQKVVGGHYAPGLYCATFCGIVPATAPRLVVLVSLDFDKKARYHQGGNSAGPVFRRITTAALRYLMVAPDNPSELEDEPDEDEYDNIINERIKRRAGEPLS